jgi:DNA-binding transcriptional ArsR family regulator
VITQIDGQATDTITALQAYIQTKSSGDSVNLTILRAGTSTNVTVTLGDRPAQVTMNNGNGNGNGNADDNGKDKSGSSIGGSENGTGKNAGDNKADNLNGTSGATGTNKTDVVQQIVSTPVIQASVMALLMTYPAAVAPSVSPPWWNTETLFKRFFFMSGSIGEKIRRKNVLRNRKRREIYYFVVNFPYSHFRRITRVVGVGPNEGSWHLRILEKMGMIKSEHLGRYLVYHANNSSNMGSQDRPASIIPNGNATRILEYLLRNPGVKITNVTRALMMNRNTASYHIKRMQTSGLVERVERDGLRLARTGDVQGGLVPVIANPMASRIELALPKVDLST